MVVGVCRPYAALRAARDAACAPDSMVSCVELLYGILAELSAEALPSGPHLHHPHLLVPSWLQVDTPNEQAGQKEDGTCRWAQ